MLGKKEKFRERLLDWYGEHRRTLPWRAGEGMLPPAYHVMVSEFMLQQTQVKMALPFFEKFMATFPTVAALAESDEQDVLRLWQGLGYYSRARNLRRAAGEIQNRFGGVVPTDVEELRTLPGIGRYTAGAIASIAHDQCAPIVDANVARVICRLDMIREDPKEKKVLDVLWKRAEELVPAKRAGDFNSAMMELGATVCLPRGPVCERCPVRRHCEAAREGVQNLIPPPRASRVIPLIKRVTICVEKKGKWLMEQRPANGRWGSMWQFTTFASPMKFATEARRAIQKIGVVRHDLSHRRYEFIAYRANGEIEVPAGENRKWVPAKKVGEYPMSKPQREIARMLGIVGAGTESSSLDLL